MSMSVIPNVPPAPAAVRAEDGGGDDMDWAFGLEGPETRLYTCGLNRRLSPGPAVTLGARVRAFFGEGGRNAGPGLLVGAMPFDREADDCLFQPASVAQTPWPQPAAVAAPAPVRWNITPEPERAAYEAAVRAALAAIAASSSDAPLEKVVLSRSLRLAGAHPIDPFALLGRLAADPSATRFLTPTGPRGPGAMARLVGASPELLVSRRGDAVLSHPLAGSARRALGCAEDEAAAQALLRSEKDRREHAVVVEAILDALAPICAELTAPAEPALVSTRTMWHLGTRIEGRLARPDEVSAAEVAALLHPTPAVAGTPRDRATRLIGELEGYDRAFYAGAVGWTDAAGDGAWYVALRCAEVCEAQARLYAGAGIVAGSDPAAEAAETFAKFRTMLRALGVEETGEGMESEL